MTQWTMAALLLATILSASGGASGIDVPPEDEIAVQALRDIQVKWIADRDAKCGWPAVFFQGGTIAGPLAAACLNDMTARRANELADYLDWTQN